MLLVHGCITDHCHPKKLGSIHGPRLLVGKAWLSMRVAAGQGPLFQSHMYDPFSGSELPMAKNLATWLLRRWYGYFVEYHKRCAELDIILEIETGVVG